MNGKTQEVKLQGGFNNPIIWLHQILRQSTSIIKKLRYFQTHSAFISFLLFFIFIFLFFIQARSYHPLVCLVPGSYVALPYKTMAGRWSRFGVDSAPLRALLGVLLQSYHKRVLAVLKSLWPVYDTVKIKKRKIPWRDQWRVDSPEKNIQEGGDPVGIRIKKEMQEGAAYSSENSSSIPR